MRIWISAWFLAIAIGGCGSSPPPDQPAADKDPPRETVLDDMIKTEDRAKAAGAQVEDRVNQLNKQLDVQEGGDAGPQDPDASPNPPPNP
ncbi:MAG TPA: hypothetical protein VE046_06240 [Steroidobacteraceae bacterium]|nr:hypothetical protein [Steroidobacteraceae bacterium]